MAEPRTKTVGLVGLFDDAASLLRAAERVRDAGYRKWDCHTPWPVEGLERAMGLKRSPIGGIALVGGAVGLLAAVALTGGLSVLHYPIRVGGKPLFSWQAFVPIFFELFVLFAALTTLAAAVVLCRLGRHHSPLHDSGLMGEVTSRRFAVVLRADDESFADDRARALLAASGCRDIRPLVEIQEEDEAGK